MKLQNPVAATVAFVTATITGSTVACAENFTNPVLWEDLADNDVFRVGDGAYQHVELRPKVINHGNHWPDT